MNEDANRVRPAYQSRVIDERYELDQKLEKLGLYLNSAGFLSLSSEEQKRMTRQFQIMYDYRAVLDQRIDAFPRV